MTIWKNMVEPDRPQMTIQHFARWMTKVVDIYSEYLLLIAFPRKDCYGKAP
jgi:hypothetical protein